MENFKPVRDRVLIEKIKDDLKTKSGLIVSQDAQERPTKGTVIAVGPGRMNDEGSILPMVVAVGDTILYPKYAGHPAKIDSEEYLILEEKEVLAILKEGV